MGTSVFKRNSSASKRLGSEVIFRYAVTVKNDFKPCKNIMMVIA